MFRVSDRRILRKSEIFMKILIYKQKKWWYYNFNETKRNKFYKEDRESMKKAMKKVMKRRLALLLAVLTGMLALSGCGRSESGGGV